MLYRREYLRWYPIYDKSAIWFSNGVTSRQLTCFLIYEGYNYDQDIKLCYDIEDPKRECNASIIDASGKSISRRFV